MVDYFNFDDVLSELNVSEEELRRMVSEGELRAFRSENKMKFRKEDVEVLQKGKESEPTIILPTDEQTAGGTDELSLDLDIGTEAEELTAEPEPAPPPPPKAKPKSAPRPAVKVPPKPAPKPPEPEPELELTEEPAVEAEPEIELSPEEPAEEVSAEVEEESVIAEEGGLDDLTIADEGSVQEAEETLVEEDMDTASTTAPLAFADESGGEAAEEETATGEITEEGEAVEGGATAPRRARRGTGAMAAVAEAAPAKAGIVWTIFLFLGFLPCAMVVAVFVDDFMLHSGTTKQPGSSVLWMYDMALDNFWKDGTWKTQMSKEAPTGTVGVEPTEVLATEGQVSDSGKYKIYLRPYNGKTYLVGDQAKTGVEAEPAAP